MVKRPRPAAGGCPRLRGLQSDRPTPPEAATPGRGAARDARRAAAAAVQGGRAGPGGGERGRGAGRGVSTIIKDEAVCRIVNTRLIHHF